MWKYLEYIENQEESIIEKILKDWLENYFATMFEDARLEELLKLLLPVTDPDILKQTKFGGQEYLIIKNLAYVYLHRQRILTEYVAVQSL